MLIFFKCALNDGKGNLNIIKLMLKNTNKLKARHYRQKLFFFFIHWSILRFWLVIICCFIVVARKHSKYTFKCLFDCTLSIYACRFKLQYIFKFFFSCTEPEISTLVALTYTKLYRFIPICILRGLFIYHMPGFIQLFIPLFLFSGC